MPQSACLSEGGGVKKLFEQCPSKLSFECKRPSVKHVLGVPPSSSKGQTIAFFYFFIPSLERSVCAAMASICINFTFLPFHKSLQENIEMGDIDKEIRLAKSLVSSAGPVTHVLWLNIQSGNPYNVKVFLTHISV